MKLSELAIFTDSVAESVAFYERLLGQSPIHQNKDMAIFKEDGLQILIHRTYAVEPGKLPPDNHVAFSVPSLDHTIRTLESRGLEIQYPQQDYSWGRSAYLRDPLGNLIELHEDSK